MKTRSASLVAFLASIPAITAQTATQNVANPAGAAYVAGVDSGKTGVSVKGGIIVTNAEGQGTQFTINFWDLPAEGGPFLYHIHTGTVPDNGNCTATGGHLDPYNRTETPACDSSNPANCQVGDLSGKHGKMDNGTVYSASYTDPYVSLIPSTPAFFGNRSYVIHYANTTRYACGNFAFAPSLLGNHFGGNEGNGHASREHSSWSSDGSWHSRTRTWDGSDSMPTGGFGGDWGSGFGGFGRPTVSSLTANNGNNAALSSWLSSIGYSGDTVTQTVTITAQNAVVTDTVMQAVTVTDGPAITAAPTFSAQNVITATGIDSELPPLPETVSAQGVAANALIDTNATATGLRTNQLSSATYTPAQVSTSGAVQVVMHWTSVVTALALGLMFGWW